ncbi:MAG: SsrA-binding protein SmpB [Candidatus Marinimicrobia bacterium]|nr:SsrA-binding protein SmpB [Candidatus Neomarinimicrobiota bacterium]
MEKQFVTKNRKAYHEFHILDKLEAGVELTGSEVKSLREGHANLKEAYATIRGSELFLIGCHINPYSHTGYKGHEPLRDRKLLLHKNEILKIKQQLAEKGLTVIPLSIYFKDSWAKIEIGLAKGKKIHDKKAAIKERDIKRETDREMSRYK